MKVEMYLCLKDEKRPDKAVTRCLQL